MLEGSGQRQLLERRIVATRSVQDLAGDPRAAIHGHALCFEALIEQAVVVGVMAFLAHELAYALQKLRAFDHMLERSHRIDKVFLTIRKYCRERAEEVRQRRATGIPVLGELLCFEIEAHPPEFERNGARDR